MASDQTLQKVNIMKNSVKILTLNCWGVPVPVACKLRHERMVAIGDEVAMSTYEIAVFQEIWHKGDYELLKSKIGKTLPYSHYFYSGMIGSGLCLFSKFPITETLFHKFALNGYAHKVHHGDWFGGKGVGLAVIDVEGFNLHLYVTHVHAEYNRENDEYLAHRVSQSFNLSQFVKFSSQLADFVVVCGDLNLEPVDLGYKIIRTNAGLGDAWVDKKCCSSEDLDGNTCDCPSNSFVSSKKNVKYPNGKRIDYILYKMGPDIELEVSECSVAMGRAPGKPFNFSDHEGVTALMTFHRKPGAGASKPEEPLSSLLQEAVTVIDKGLSQTQTNTRFFLAFAAVCLILAYLISVVHIPYPLDFIMTIFKLILILSTGFAVVQNFIMIRSEVHGLESTRDDVKHLLRKIS